jgi:hypothetical protein
MSRSLRARSLVWIPLLLAACGPSRAPDGELADAAVPAAAPPAPAPAAIGAAVGPFAAADGRLVHRLAASHAEASFGRAGVSLRGPRIATTLRLRAFGHEGALRAVAQVAPQGDAAGARFAYDGVVEWWQATRDGLEQGFTVDAPPPGARGALIAEVGVDGGLVPEVARGVVFLRDANGAVRATMRDLAARDADGRPLACSFEAVAGAIRIRVDDASARFPIAIDPTVGIERELQPPDLSDGAGLGSWLSAQGDVLIAGAPAQSVLGHNYGAAYVFRRDPTTNTWPQDARLTPSDGGYGDTFGSSVALGTDLAVVGAPSHAIGTPVTGAAYVYTRTGGTWSQSQMLTASDKADGDAFGTAVALLGDLLFVGAPYVKVSGVSQAGAVYVFARDAATGVWSQQAKLVSKAPLDSDRMGQSLAPAASASTLTLLVGAPNQLVTWVGEGGVLVFSRPVAGGAGTPWTHVTTLHASDGAGAERFGTAVSLDGEVAAIGSPYVDAGTSAAGAVYLYTHDPVTGTWTEAPRLLSSHPQTNDFFGSDVALRGGTLVVGASGLTHDALDMAGGAFFLTKSGATWSERRAVASDAKTADSFGFAVALDSGRAFVGATGHPLSASTLAAGAIYVYDPVAGLANGGACARGVDCTSGFCVDGVCCDRACTGQCEACGASGTCAALDGVAPHAGKTACAAPYKLCAAGACATTCASSSDCASSAYCAANACVPRLAVGTACAKDADCGTGHCVDSICCDTACTDTCAACDLVGKKGTCSTVTGAPHGARACAGGAGDPQCGARCDGADGAACHPASASTACGKQSCSGYTYTETGSCDGAGACNATAKPCPGNLACGTDGRCKTTCATSADCVLGAPCVAGACGAAAKGTCSADHQSSTPAGSGAPISCAPYRCSDVDGICASGCATSDECAPGASCEQTTRLCTAGAQPDTGSSGGCALGGRAGSSAAAALAGLAALGLFSRRRARR